MLFCFSHIAQYHENKVIVEKKILRFYFMYLFFQEISPNLIKVIFKVYPNYYCMSRRVCTGDKTTLWMDMKQTYQLLFHYKWTRRVSHKSILFLATQILRNRLLYIIIKNLLSSNWPEIPFRNVCNQIALRMVGS